MGDEIAVPGKWKSPARQPECIFRYGRATVPACFEPDQDQKFVGIISPINFLLLNRFAIDIHSGAQFLFILLDAMAELRMLRYFVTQNPGTAELFRASFDLTMGFLGNTSALYDVTLSESKTC